MRQLLVSSLLALTGCATWTSQQARPAPAAGARPAAQPQVRSDVQAIADLEDRRSLGDGRLMQTAITERDPLLRKRAFLALGRIQDPNTAGAMVEGLSDPDPGVRGEAAFAIGLLGMSWAPLADEVKNRLTNGLLEKEAVESDPAVKLSMLEAMGRVATPALIERLADRLTVEGEVRGRAALSLGVAARTKAPLPSRAFPALALLLKKENPIGARYRRRLRAAADQERHGAPVLLDLRHRRGLRDPRAVRQGPGRRRHRRRRGDAQAAARRSRLPGGGGGHPLARQARRASASRRPARRSARWPISPSAPSGWCAVTPPAAVSPCSPWPSRASRPPASRCSSRCAPSWPPAERRARSEGEARRRHGSTAGWPPRSIASTAA